MVLPESHHAAQKIRTAQERAVQHGRSADHDMAAAAGSEVAAVIGEFFGSQPIVACFLEEYCVDLFKFVPSTRGRQVYFQHAGIGSDAESSHTRLSRLGVSR